MEYIGESISKCQTKLVRGTRKYEWSEYHGNIVSCELGDSAGEVDNNTEIITVNTKSLTMTVEAEKQEIKRNSNDDTIVHLALMVWHCFSYTEFPGNPKNQYLMSIQFKPVHTNNHNVLTNL
ncbi:unnamed protein product [Fasciola hepatica]|uniref:Uncharacterized protein n=1 Tax=Fasciola hepatica TaxID=6192 RepID=A0ABC9HHV0_FASHE